MKLQIIPKYNRLYNSLDARFTNLASNENRGRVTTNEEEAWTHSSRRVTICIDGGAADKLACNFMHTSSGNWVEEARIGKRHVRRLRSTSWNDDRRQIRSEIRRCRATPPLRPKSTPWISTPRRRDRVMWQELCVETRPLLLLSPNLRVQVAKSLEIVRRRGSIGNCNEICDGRVQPRRVQFE